MNDINIIDVDEADFNEKIIEASESKLIIVDFWAPWCGPCKQLTPILEKVVKKSTEKVILAKVNIDENQQIASQLRIQSIPTVFAFKNKQIVNAFQGVLPETDIIKFIEKALGEKLEKDNSEFYQNIELLIKNKNFIDAKDALIEFISTNPKDIKSISLLLECMIETSEESEVSDFLNSLEDEVKNDKEIIKIVKRLEILKNNMSGPSIDALIEKLKTSPNDIDNILELSNKYFVSKKYDESFELLIKNYPKNKDRVKKQLLDFFEALGGSNEKTVHYRKKLSSIMFS
tara:strand:+ start:231 stop:1094 length:864 start_codon:yes stop_codon:yes gene_type:complete